MLLRDYDFMKENATVNYDSISKKGFVLLT